MKTAFGNNYYNRSGEPITLEEWGRMILQKKHKNVQQTNVGPYLVSTVWLGNDHNWDNEGPPIIFETMIFDRTTDDESFNDIYMDRYATEEDALLGHGRAINKAEEFRDGKHKPGFDDFDVP